MSQGMKVTDRDPKRFPEIGKLLYFQVYLSLSENALLLTNMPFDSYDCSIVSWVVISAVSENLVSSGYGIVYHMILSSRFQVVHVGFNHDNVQHFSNITNLFNHSNWLFLLSVTSYKTLEISIECLSKSLVFKIYNYYFNMNFDSCLYYRNQNTDFHH